MGDLMTDSAATKQDIKRMTLRMIRLQDDFRELEVKVKLMSESLHRHAQILAVRPIPLE